MKKTTMLTLPGKIKREEKQRDKTSLSRALTMDLQALLLAPKSNISAVYYNTMHNMIFFDLQRCKVDGMHSTIERKLRSVYINVPADYISICNSARRVPQVLYLSHDFFKNFSSSNFLTSNVGDPTVTELIGL